MERRFLLKIQQLLNIRCEPLNLDFQATNVRGARCVGGVKEGRDGGGVGYVGG